jgi:hypothetical protein
LKKEWVTGDGEVKDDGDGDIGVANRDSSIVILHRGYHDSRHSALFPTNSNSNSNDSSGTDDAEEDDAERDNKPHHGILPQHIASGFLYHLQDNQEIRIRGDFLLSKSHSISWDDGNTSYGWGIDPGFDAETGIAVVYRKTGTKIQSADLVGVSA